MTVKKINPKLTNREPLKKEEILGEYLSTKDLKKKPLYRPYITELAIELIDWAKNDPKALKLQQFSTKKDLEYSTFTAWAAKYEDMGKAFEIAKQAIGNRRETEARTLSMLPEMITKSMHTYDPEWDSINKYHAQLKNEAQGLFGGSNIQVILEAVENSPMVPERKVKDE